MINLSGKSFGRYHIIEPLGEGGMATVYKAYDNSLERNVAVKVIRTDQGADEEFLKRFRREAKALAQLDHPYILKVLDFGEQEGVPYLVMPYLSGGTLKAMMKGKAMPFQEAARLLASIASALEYAHNMGIVHRDVKPANILISQSGEPILSDFGIAKMLERGENTQLTGTGMSIGTPDYMAPEQWMGHAEARSDIYALGVVFYELVTGRRPYTADTPAAVLLKHVNDPLPRPTQFVDSLPGAVEQVLVKALAKRPDNRYQTMGAFASALEGLARMETPVGAAPSAVEQQMLQQAQLAAGGISGGTPLLGRSDMPGSKPKTEASMPPVQVNQGMPIWMTILIGVVLIGLVSAVCVVAGGGAYFLAGGKSVAVVTPVDGSTQDKTPEAPIDVTNGGDQSPTAVVIDIATATEAPTATVGPLESFEGYPKDIPFLKENKGDLMTTNSSGAQTFMFSTDLTQADVIDFYNKGLKKDGWENTYTSKDVANKTYMTMFTKANRMVIVNAMEGIKGVSLGKTSVMVTLSSN